MMSTSPRIAALFACALFVAPACDDEPESNTTNDATSTTDATTGGDATTTSDATTGGDATTTTDATATTDATVDADPDVVTPVSGLSARPSNGTCLAPAREVRSGPLTWNFAPFGGEDGLNLMMMRQAPDGTWIQIYREGQVYTVGTDNTRSASPILTIPDVHTEGEMGLLGLALHPDFANTPQVFFYYTTLEPNGDNTRVHIDRYTVNLSDYSIDAGTRAEIFTFNRQVPWTNHIGGSIEFDPVASTPTLYAAMGDAERQDQVQQMGAGNYYGKLLRFDVSGATPVTPEVVGIGLRNPFRWSFDSLTGDLWIGDVGDSDWEELNRVMAADIPASGETPINFGWPIMEGFECRTGSDPANSCGHSSPITLPVNAYGRNLGVSIIGGRTYRGSAIAGIAGNHIFNDIFPQGGERSWMLEPNPSEDPGTLDDDYRRVVLDEGGFVAFTEDNQGEIYGMAMWGGVYRLEVSDDGGEPQEAMPGALSETGCFGAAGAPSEGLIPYDLNAPLWSDGATKARWLALPDGASVSLTETGDFEFPNGTILAKEFTLDGVRVETRLFIRHPDGVWAGYSYAWVDDAGQALGDAELLSDSVVTRSVPGTDKTWTYPSRGQCTQCHTAAAGGSLGIEVGQLNRDLTYPSSGVTANQVFTLREIGIISDDITPFGDRAFPRYDDTSVPVADRAWSYLHSNCANCHQPGASGMGGRSAMPDVRYDLFHDGGGTHPLAQMLCGVEAGAGDLGLGAPAHLVEPGSPGDWADLGSGGSVLYLRMAARADVSGSTGTMPLIGSAVADEQTGLPLMREWIQGLQCP